MQTIQQIIDRKINYLEVVLGLSQVKACTKEESQKYQEMLNSGQQLPEGVEKPNDYFIIRSKYNDDEKTKKLLIYQLCSQVQTIKKCMVFLTALTAISLAVTVIAIIAMTS